MANKWQNDREFSDLDPEVILAYRNYMLENFGLVKRYKAYFLRESKIPTDSKIERLEELIDFFILEGDFEKVEEISEIRNVLEIKLLISDVSN